MTVRDWPQSVVVAAWLICLALICGLLYWARLILIPIALASLLTFLLTPLVLRLQRKGIARIPAVVLVVVVAAALCSGLGYLVASQVTQLVNDLPQHEHNIETKISDLRSMFKGGLFDKVEQSVERIERKLENDEKTERSEQTAPPGPTADEPPVPNGLTGDDPPAGPEADEEEPVSVRIDTDAEATPLPDVAAFLPVLEILGTAGLVIVLVVFMLIGREDLRNRLISLTSRSSLAITTKAIDDAAHRISRYLMMQFIINATYGLTLGLALLLIGVPYAALWGFCAAVLRYIPYIGPWLAALLPIATSLITSPGWSQVLIVVGAFVVLELVSNNVMEPWLYGQSVGLSPMAVIVAAIFWTWMWGSVGLVLSTPLTVCLVVLGRYVPALSFLDRLLGERLPLAVHHAFYQRLIARDEEEAEEIAEAHVAEYPLEKTCDELLLPTLSLVQRDRSRGHLTEGDEAFVLRAVEGILEELAEMKTPLEEAEPVNGAARVRPLIIGLPARDRADGLALEMLQELLDPAQCQFEVLSPEQLISENIATIEERKPACVCLMSIPPGDLLQMRRVCKRLRHGQPKLKIIAARIGIRGLTEKNRNLLLSSGADQAVGSLTGLRDALLPVIQFYQHVNVVQAEAPVVAGAT